MAAHVSELHEDKGTAYHSQAAVQIKYTGLGPINYEEHRLGRVQHGRLRAHEYRAATLDLSLLKWKDQKEVNIARLQLIVLQALTFNFYLHHRITTLFPIAFLHVFPFHPSKSFWRRLSAFPLKNYEVVLNINKLSTLRIWIRAKDRQAFCSLLSWPLGASHQLGVSLNV